MHVLSSIFHKVKNIQQGGINSEVESSFFFFWLCCVLVAAYEIYFPEQRMNSGPPALGEWSLSHGSTWEVPLLVNLALGLKVVTETGCLAAVCTVPGVRDG